MSDWKLKIVTNVFAPGFSILLYRKVGDKIQFMAPANEPVYQIKEYTESGSFEKPAALVNISMGTMIDFPDILSQLQQELHELGVKAPEKSYIEGKLVATEKHLEDMRKMVLG